MSHGDPVRELREVRAMGPPESIDDVDERLNLIERLLSGLTADDEYLRAITEVLLEINEVVNQIAGGGDVPAGVEGQLQAANNRLEDMVQGIVDTTVLPIGLQGTATEQIPNGTSGVATFEFSGGEYAAEVEASQDTMKFQDVRVVPGGDNLVEPLPTGEAPGERPIERRQVYAVDLAQSDDVFENDIQPVGQGSSFRINVSLDTATELALRTNPPMSDVDAFNETLNQGGQLEADARFEFEFDVDANASYNLRCPNSAATVNSLRLVEEKVA